MFSLSLDNNFSRELDYTMLPNQSGKRLNELHEQNTKSAGVFLVNFVNRVPFVCGRILREMPRQIHLPLVAVLLGTAACAAVQPVNPNGPRRNEPAYPVLLTDNQQRKEGAAAGWAQLAQARGAVSPPAIALQPVTATIRNLPDNLSTPLILPHVGTGTEMNEEEARESLRRFLNQWQKLLGANPAQLSLAQQTKDADGTNLAVYEQRPFSYPLRGAYGRIEIRFANDRRIMSLSSTAIPDADKIQTALSAAAPRLKVQDVTTHLAGRKVAYTDSAGIQRSYVIGPESKMNIQQVVVYPLSSNKPGTLEFHLAWEINLTDAPIKTIYYDALQDEVLTAS